MTDHSSMYRLVFPAPSVDTGDGVGPVLVHALEGFADAGHGVKLTADHLRESLHSELVAYFDTDSIIDYRSRRPMMTFAEDQITDVDMPRLQLHVVRDNSGRPFLLLSGSEPDLRWEGFVDAVKELADRFSVSTVIGLNSIPMAIPHTRPATLTAHGDDDLIEGLPKWGGALKFPASASMLLELRLGQAGYPALGLSVHVPHYLSQTDYPAAALKAVTSLGGVAGLDLPIAALENAAESMRTQIDAEVDGNAEVEGVVRALESQYDSFAAGQSEERSLLAADEPLPSGDELGAEFEKYLAQHHAGDNKNPDDPTDEE